MACASILLDIYLLCLILELSAIDLTCCQVDSPVLRFWRHLLKIFPFGTTGDRLGEPLRLHARTPVFFTKHMLAPGLQFLLADYGAVNSGTSIDFSYFTTQVCRRSK